jgi:hypothetical protein
MLGRAACLLGHHVGQRLKRPLDVADRRLNRAIAVLALMCSLDITRGQMRDILPGLPVAKILAQQIQLAQRGLLIEL